MSLLKQNDERMRNVIKTGRLVMPYYSYRGQEAIPAAICTLLWDSDTISTIYRGVHDVLAKGRPVDQRWAELAGRVTGTCKGKGGPMHITHPASGMLVTTGIVGSSMPIATGMAWANKLKGNDDVTFVFFGDAASNIGAFHESLNLASSWKLPVIFVCSNNLYGEHTTAIDEIAKRRAAYSMPGVRVNGNDPVEVYNAAQEAIDRARAGEGPSLIEAMTFRFHGHVFGDAEDYMTRARRRCAPRTIPGRTTSASSSTRDTRRRLSSTRSTPGTRPRSKTPWPSRSRVNGPIPAKSIATSMPRSWPNERQDA
jgi:pyruvate dehydrogenase E1 component alpha subunit